MNVFSKSSQSLQRAVALAAALTLALGFVVADASGASAATQTVSPRSALPVASPTGCATTYYVKPTGNDLLSGTSVAAVWSSIAQVNKTRLLPGTCVLFAGGNSYAGSLQILDNGIGGSDANSTSSPVVIGSYGTSKATITSTTSDGIIVSNVGGVTVQDLVLIGTRGASINHGINLFNGLGSNNRRPGILIQRLDIKGYGGSGIIFGGGNLVNNIKSGFTNLTIKDSDLHNNADSGIQSYGNLCSGLTSYSSSQIFIANVSAYNNQGIPNKMVMGCAGTSEATNSGSGIVLGDVDNATIQYSYAYGNGAKNNFPGGGPVGIWAYNANAVTIQYSTSFSNRSLTKDGGGFDLDGGVTNSLMQYNYSYDNNGAGYLVFQYQNARPLDNNVVRYNISRNDSRGQAYGGITVGSDDPSSGALNTFVYGNTVFMSANANGGSAGIRVWERSQGAYFYNNIIHTTGGVPLVSVEKNTSAIFLGNDYFAGGAFSIRQGGGNYSDVGSTNYTSFAAWQAATGLEKINGINVGKTANPGYYDTAVTGPSTYIDPNNFGLFSNSAMRGAGIDPTQFQINPGPRDFFGVTLPPSSGLYSIGASQGN